MARVTRKADQTAIKTWSAAELEAIRKSPGLRPDWREEILATPRHRLPFKIEMHALAHIQAYQQARRGKAGR